MAPASISFHSESAPVDEPAATMPVLVEVARLDRSPLPIWKVASRLPCRTDETCNTRSADAETTRAPWTTSSLVCLTVGRPATAVRILQVAADQMSARPMISDLCEGRGRTSSPLDKLNCVTRPLCSPTRQLNSVWSKQTAEMAVSVWPRSVRTSAPVRASHTRSVSPTALMTRSRFLE
eukprot:scaffold4961_cov114-Isochrysis_galbana.AAC.7